MLFLSASRVIQNLLSSMQYPRDQRLVTELAKFNIQITELIDQITLNADENDLTLSALRELAKNQPAWPTLVRPGDDKFTATKIEKLNVGSKAPVRLLSRNAKRYPSLKTPRNRLVLGLIGGIRKYTKTILLTRRKGGPVQHCRPKEARKRLQFIEPGIPEKQRTRFLALLREASDYPFSAENLSKWTRIVVEFVLIIDPELNQFPELKQVKSAKGGKYIKTPEARFRSELSKFFRPALKNLLA